MQFAVHGLFLRFRMSPLPRGFDHADDSLATRMHVDVLHRDFLLALAAMAIERFEEGGVRSGLKRPIYFMAACLASQSGRSDRSRCIDSDRHPDTCAARWAAFRCDALFPEEGEQLVADCTAPAMH